MIHNHSVYLDISSQLMLSECLHQLDRTDASLEYFEQLYVFSLVQDSVDDLHLLHLHSVVHPKKEKHIILCGYS